MDLVEIGKDIDWSPLTGRDAEVLYASLERLAESSSFFAPWAQRQIDLTGRYDRMSIMGQGIQGAGSRGYPQDDGARQAREAAFQSQVAYATSNAAQQHEVRDKSVIDQRIQTLHALVEEIHAAIGSLELRTARVCNPQLDKQPSASGSSSLTQQSEVAGQLALVGEGMRSAIARCHMLINALEL